MVGERAGAKCQENRLRARRVSPSGLAYTCRAGRGARRGANLQRINNLKWVHSSRGTALCAAALQGEVAGAREN